MGEELSRIQAGMLLGGHYEIIAAGPDQLEIGSGAMGAVYLARDTQLHRKVAIKTIQTQRLKNAAEREQFIERFMKESLAAAACSHPAIVTLYAASEPDDAGFTWYAMEWIENAQDLQARLQSLCPPPGTSTMPFSEITQYLMDAADALREIHGKGIVHRDIKLPNLLTYPTPDGRRLKLLDFGIARLPESEQTATVQMLGTPGYLSPEQARSYILGSRHAPAPSNDLFALGVVAYRLLTGHKPFNEEGLGLLQAICSHAPEPIEQHRPDVPAGLQHVTMRLLEKDPSKRFVSAQEVLVALRGLDALPFFTPSEAGTGSGRDAATNHFGAGLELGSQSFDAAEAFSKVNSANLSGSGSIQLSGAAADFANLHQPATPKAGVQALPRRTKLALLGGAAAIFGLALIAFISLGTKNQDAHATAVALPSAAQEPAPKEITGAEILRLQREAAQDDIVELDRKRRAAQAAAEIAPLEQITPTPEPQRSNNTQPRQRASNSQGTGALLASAPVATIATQPDEPKPRVKNVQQVLTNGPATTAKSDGTTLERLGVSIDTKMQARLTSALSSDAPDTLVTAVLERPFKGPGMAEPLPAGTKFLGKASYKMHTQRVDISFTQAQLPRAATTIPISAIAIEPNGQAGLIGMMSKRDDRAKANAGEAVVDLAEAIIGDSPGSRAAGRYTGDKRQDAQALRSAGSGVLSLPLNKKLLLQFTRES